MSHRNMMIKRITIVSLLFVATACADDSGSGTALEIPNLTDTPSPETIISQDIPTDISDTPIETCDPGTGNRALVWLWL